jgi:hypothetical protein
VLYTCHPGTQEAEAGRWRGGGQPGLKYNEFPISKKPKTKQTGQARWQKSVIPASQEEIGKIKVQDQSKQRVSETPSQPISQAWHTSVLPGFREA